MKIRNEDKIKVIAGKYKGVESVVQKVYNKESKVLVKDVNIVVRHIKATQSNEGGRVKVERPIDVSKVMLVCPSCNKPTRVGFKEVEGKKVRICKKCKKTI